MKESKIDLTERLRREGRWSEASKFKDAKLAERKNGEEYLAAKKVGSQWANLYVLCLCIVNPNWARNARMIQAFG